MLTVTLYLRRDCSLCDQVKAELDALQKTVPHRLVEIDVDADDAWQDYSNRVPVLEVGPYRLQAPITRQELIVTLRAAADRQRALESLGDPAYARARAQGQTVSWDDRLSHVLARHYLLLFNLCLAFYVGLPFLAPILKKARADSIAHIIYRIYSPLCHEFAFRSWFLFGEQAYYPLALANLPGVKTFEEASGILAPRALLYVQARLFEGNERMGYKVALCQRDVAIWGALSLFGLLFAVTGRRFKPLPAAIWLLFGVLPVALDGGTQLLGQLSLPALADLLPLRESTPFLRTLTGFLFGFLTAWFALPRIEESMAETRRLLARKFAILDFSG